MTMTSKAISDVTEARELLVAITGGLPFDAAGIPAAFKLIGKARLAPAAKAWADLHALPVEGGLVYLVPA